MTLILDRSNPKIAVKTRGFDPMVGTTIIRFGDYDVPMNDFLSAVHYVLTNTDLQTSDDERLQFVKCVKSMKVVDGWNQGRKRLNTSIEPVVR